MAAQVCTTTYTMITKIRKDIWVQTVLPVYRVARWAGHPWAALVDWEKYSTLWKIQRAIKPPDLEVIFYTEINPHKHEFPDPHMCNLYFPSVEEDDYETAACETTLEDGNLRILSCAGKVLVDYRNSEGLLISPLNWDTAHPNDIEKITAVMAIAGVIAPSVQYNHEVYL